MQCRDYQRRRRVIMNIRLVYGTMCAAATARSIVSGYEPPVWIKW